jgi:hypothetical protein
MLKGRERVSDLTKGGPGSLLHSHRGGKLFKYIRWHAAQLVAVKSPAITIPSVKKGETNARERLVSEGADQEHRSTSSPTRQAEEQMAAPGEKEVCNTYSTFSADIRSNTPAGRLFSWLLARYLREKNSRSCR